MTDPVGLHVADPSGILASYASYTSKTVFRLILLLVEGGLGIVSAVSALEFD